MTTDGLKGFSVTYNLLNLPSQVSKSSENISYIYTAAGAKLAKFQNGTLKQLYAGSLVYNESKALDYILHDEGMVVKSGGGYTYQYYLKDHLGNTRVVFEPTTSGIDVKQVADYYPFGSRFVPFSPESTNKYLYNGKELQDDVIGGAQLNWLDYGWREYDPQLGRFHIQDRFSEKYYDLSNYQYATNNPILFIDVNGDSINIAEKYRNLFNSALESIFGANSKNFSYTKSGNLVYKGSKEDFKGDASEMFNQVNKVMGETTTTNVIYEQTYIVKLNDGSDFTIDTRSRGGGSALTVFDSKGFSNENYVVVDPNATKTFTVDEMGPAYYKGTPATTTNWYAHSVNVNTTTENTTWHEVGHVVYQGKTQDNVINFDNRARSLKQNGYNYTSIRTLTNQRVYMPAPLSPRPYDETHNRLIK